LESKIPTIQNNYKRIQNGPFYNIVYNEIGTLKNTIVKITLLPSVNTIKLEGDDIDSIIESVIDVDDYKFFNIVSMKQFRKNKLNPISEREGEENGKGGKRRTRKNNKKKRSIRKKRNSKSKGKKSRKQRRRTK
jgi:hypothetical protein